jgi:hypothetical protein
MTQTSNLPTVITATSAAETRKAYRREWMRQDRAKAKGVNSDRVNTKPVNTDSVNTKPVNSDRVNTESVNTEPKAAKAPRIHLTEGERFRGQEFLRRAERHGGDSKPGVYFLSRFEEMAASLGAPSEALKASLA